MLRIRVLTPLCIALFLVLRVFAAEQDPSDVFLRAFLAVQTAEKLEADGKDKAALNKFLFAASLLDQIRSNNPNWQPLVLEYRSKKTRDRIASLQSKLASDQDLSPSPVEPALPTPSDNNLIPENPTDQIPASTPSTSDNTIPSDNTDIPGSSEASELRRQLNEAKLEVRRLRQENISLTQRYEQSSSNLRDALKKIDQSRVAIAELRSELSTSEDRLRTVMADRTATAQQLESVKGEVTKLKKEISDRVADRTLIEDEASDLAGQVTSSNRLAAQAKSERDQAVKDKETATQARDAALAEVTKLQGEKEKADQILADNAALTTKLDAAEKQIAQLSSQPSSEDIAKLKQQISEMQGQLSAAQEQNKGLQQNIEELKKQLDVSNQSLADARQKGLSNEETAQLKTENDLLRTIVLRSLKEQIKRSQARQIVTEELAKVEGKSQTLLDQVDVLGAPSLQLTDDERKLFKAPDLAALDASASDAGLSVEATQPDGTTPPADANAANAAPSPKPDQTTVIPDNLAPLVEKARGYFDKGLFGQAEKTYNEILDQDPNNLFALSNLGVVHFKAGKLIQAEKVLTKAVAVAPKDFFARSTLGIVYYRQGKFDKAIESLTQALTIDPANAQAHNYLGIAASQKGWIEAATQELRKAVTLNPKYADAYFNLAVIYATAEPPSLDLAKENYQKAVELGADPDPSLEKLLK